LSQGGSLGDHDFATSIDFDEVVIGGIDITICLANLMFLLVQLVQVLFEPNFSLIERQDHLIIISFVVITGLFKAFVGSAKLVHAFGYGVAIMCP
jgi:hypothetical protein